MERKEVLLCLALAGAGFCLPAAAELPPLPPGEAIELAPLQERFSELDTDADGYLTREEAGVRMALQFPRHDTNEDGVIDYSEFSVFAIEHNE